MGKQRSALQSLGIIATVLVVLGGSLGAIGYVYVERKQEYLAQRNLRLLAGQGARLKQIVESYAGSVLPNTAQQAWQNAAAALKQSGSTSRPFEAASASTSRTSSGRAPSVDGSPTVSKRPAVAADRPPKDAEADDLCKVLLSRPAIESAASLSGDALFCNSLQTNLTELLKLTRALKLVGSVAVGREKPELPGVSLRLAQTKGESQLQFVCWQETLPGRFMTFTAQAPVDEALGTVGADYFDDLLIVEPVPQSAGSAGDGGPGTARGNVVFQRESRSGLITSLPEVAAGEGKALALSEIGSPASGSLSIAGTGHRVFIQPLQLIVPPPLPVNPATHEAAPAPLRLMCGLVRATRFRGESMTLPHTLVLVGLLALTAVLASWPLLKLKSLGRHDSLRRSDVLFACLSVFLLGSLLVFFLLDSYAYAQLARLQDAQLRSFADQLVRRLGVELVQGQELLDRLRRDYQPGPCQIDGGPPCASLKPVPLVPEGSLLVSGHQPTPIGPGPPYFESISEIRASDGQQVLKWTTQTLGGKMINVGQREYVQKLVEERGWNGVKGPFFVEPVFSQNTGKVEALLSVPDPGAAKEENPSALKWIAAMNMKLISVRDAVAPLGMGFAIVADSGKVLFHSDLKRSRLEDFFEETDRDGALRALVFGKASGLVNAPYTGHDHRMYVTALPGLPWTAITFADKEYLRTANKEIFSEATILFFAYGLLWLLPVTLCCAWRPGWIWFGEEKGAGYALAFFVNALLFVVLLVAALRGASDRLAIAIVLLAPLGIAADFLILRSAAASFLADRARSFADGPLGGLLRTLVPARRIYLTMWASLVLLVTLVPAVTLFLAAHDLEMELLVKHEQLTLARDLDDRAERVRKDYRDVPKPDHFLTRRLGERADIYDIGFSRLAAEGEGDAACRPESARLGTMLSWIRPLYNEIAVSTGGLVQNSASDNSSHWCKGQGRLTLVRQSTTRLEPPLILAGIPFASRPGTFGEAVLLLFLVLIPPAAVCAMVRFVGTKIFWLDLAPCEVPTVDLSALPSIRESTLLLGLPPSGAASLSADPRLELIDLRALTTDEVWRARLEQALPSTGTVVAIDHFEHAMDDPAVNRQKLRLLERMLGASRTVVVASAVAPDDFPLDADRANSSGAGGAVPQGADPGPASTEEAERRRARWSLVLGRFRRCMIADSRDPHAIWAACSREERRALIDLADSGFVNAPLSTMQSLVMRGLVTRGSRLQMGEKLRAYVLEAGIAERATLVPERRTSSIAVLRSTALAAIVGMALLVFLTQPQLLSSSSAFLVAVGSLIPALLKVGDMILGRKSAA